MTTAIDPGTDALRPPLKWWQGVERYCWIVLVIAALGWLFDTMDQNLFTLVRKASVQELLGGAAGAKAGDVDFIGQLVTATFLVGWSLGGFVFGILGDRFGRTRTMIATILIYAVFTGLSGLVHSWPAYAGARFMTGFGVGGEWAAGAAMVAEVFPARSRAMALGTLQACSSFGNMLAAVVTAAMASLSWRWAYAVGAVPALLVLWIRRSVHEPVDWAKAKDRAKAAGEELGAIGELFGDSRLRRNTIAALLMAIAGQGALWGLGFWSPDLLQRALETFHVAAADAKRAASAMFFVQQVGAMVGIYAFAAFSERTNRRGAFVAWFLLAWASIPTFFWGVARAGGHPAGSASHAFASVLLCGHLSPDAQAVVVRAALLACLMGFATLGPFSGYTVYFPELYPTRLRATGCGICYNGARFLAAVIPLATGALARHFSTKPNAVAAGMPMAATVFASVYVLGLIGAFLGPETKGKALPE